MRRVADEECSFGNHLVEKPQLVIRECPVVQEDQRDSFGSRTAAVESRPGECYVKGTSPGST